MATRALTVDDVEVFRAVRLHALRNDPAAFGSTYEREAAFDDDMWRSRLAGYQGRPGQIFIDESTGGPVGVVGIGVTEDVTDSMLWGMWVDPAARATGVGRRLVDVTSEWARSHECSTVSLWVVRSNDAARRLYESCGFVVPPPGIDDGSSAPPPDGCTDELCMQFSLDV